MDVSGICRATIKKRRIVLKWGLWNTSQKLDSLHSQPLTLWFPYGCTLTFAKFHHRYISSLNRAHSWVIMIQSVYESVPLWTHRPKTIFDRWYVCPTAQIIFFELGPTNESRWFRVFLKACRYGLTAQKLYFNKRVYEPTRIELCNCWKEYMTKSCF